MGRTWGPVFALAILACKPKPDAPAAAEGVAVAAVGGFEGPEAVRYDEAQDVFFVSNFGPGSGDDRDNDGFISRVRADGTVDSLRFIAGGASGVTLHMPRGMTIHGDTLWVADADGVRGFHRVTGAPLAFVDLTSHAPGFLNDVTVGGDGALYVTDTGKGRIYRVHGGRGEIAIETRGVSGPNGITWDQAAGRFIVVPYRGGRAIYEWRPGSPAEGIRSAGGGAGKFDGVEVIGADSILVASQGDSSIYLFTGTSATPVIRVKGDPADIAWAPRHRLVAVPYIRRDTVELFRLP